MANDAKPLQQHATLIPSDARLAFRDRYLLLNRLHTVQVRQQQATAPPLGDDHTVFARIEIGCIENRLGFVED